MTRPTVFFVDDEQNILKSITRLTRDEPYDVFTFDDPREALKELDKREVAVVVADQLMPVMTGTELLEKVKSKWPNTTRMVLSGFTDITTLLSLINQGKIFHFIVKPWDNGEFKMAMNEAINHYNLLMENSKLTELTRKQNLELIELNKKLEKKVERRTQQIEERELQLKEALEGIIQAVASTLEIRDPYTAGHQKRVAGLACAIAEKMGIPADRLEGLRLAGVIHDLGKIYVPAEILNRPGKLTKTERELIHVHPQVGYDILKNITFPWPIAEIVYQHHERINGTGYPLGLAGDKILLEARILAVADVVEAMSSHRPYRPAPGIELALEEIADNKGIFYDPVVVEACLDLFAEKKITLQGWSG
jgi:putative nucleotidyltransferase with HDIG domain